MRLILKICKRMLPMLIIVSMLLGIPPAHGAQTTVTRDNTVEIIAVDKMKQLNIDFDLGDEILRANDVISKFTLDDPNRIYSFPNPQKVGAPYVPKGTLCTEVAIIGYVVSFDYKIGNVRYTAQYCNDGTVRMTSSIIADEIDYVYEISSDAPNTVRCIDCHSNDIVWEKDTATQSPETVHGELETRASVKEVNPLSYRNDPDTAPYKAKIVLTGTASLSSLQGTSYNQMQPFRVYETMWYHQQVNKRTIPYSVGVSLSSIAHDFLTSSATVATWLTAAGVLYTVGNLLSEACTVVKEHSYTFQGGKESGIFDPTSCNAYVETYSIWDEGKITLTWGYDSAGYKKPDWGHSVTSDALSLANLTVNERGKAIFNTNVNTYGMWPHGVGNFGA